MFKPAGVHTLIRQTHEDRVLRVLREHGALTRGEIADRVGLSRTTLSEITNVLLERGAITVANATGGIRAGRGRPAERLVLDPGAGQFMGVDFGHRRVRIAVSDAAHDIIASGAEFYAADSAWPERIDSCFRLIERVGEESGIHYGALQGIGIGFPGPFSPRMPKPAPVADGSSAVPAGELVFSSFVERFDASVIIDNNTRFAGLAEAIWGSAAGTQDLLYVRLSDGIGGGLVVGGQLVTGASGFAGELGHVSVSPSGVQCRCGKRGCLETIASVPAIFAGCTAKGVPIHSLDDLRAAVAKGDPIVASVLRDAGDALGRVLGSVAVALNPREIVIAGEVAQIADVIFEQAVATITYELLPVPEAAPHVRLAKLGDDDGALGAIAALFHRSPLLASYPETHQPDHQRGSTQRNIS
ncbi:ROK family transcriptional regulator [Mycetocola zhadangensis]|uniref:ROK family transcriptional regulator n=1 Tax=Mycetocola zhadangensis TaxID=1164595 RepID=A0A3L7J455_9MICO|nr:ROK family transcriptional regulator [Mycetocola zhadangensis]RLQ84221.1 ROK family transcriptional regulator [Mycetocola zhadangensis]GGE95012.1 transcriptional regulator [Mycetocola zhadangensis]